MLGIFLNPDANETLVKLLYLVHIAGVVGAFGPTFLYGRLHRNGETQTMAALHMRLVFPSLVVMWVAGMGIAGVNKISLAETWWISITILLWVVAIAVSWFLIRPAVSDTSADARAKLAAGVGVTHVVFVLSLWLMIFKPFVDGTYKLT